MSIKYMSKYVRGDIIVFGINALLVMGASAPVQKGAVIVIEGVEYLVERLRYNPWDTTRVDVYVKAVV